MFLEKFIRGAGARRPLLEHLEGLSIPVSNLEKEVHPIQGNASYWLTSEMRTPQEIVRCVFVPCQRDLCLVFSSTKACASQLQLIQLLEQTSISVFTPFLLIDACEVNKSW